MGCSITCTNAAKQANGHLVVTYSDGSQDEYTSLSDAHDATYNLDSDSALAKKWLIASWLKQDPQAASPATYVNGKTCTLDVGTYSPITVT